MPCPKPLRKVETWRTRHHRLPDELSYQTRGLLSDKKHPRSPCAPADSGRCPRNTARLFQVALEQVGIELGHINMTGRYRVDNTSRRQPLHQREVVFPAIRLQPVLIGLERQVMVFPLAQLDT